MKKFIFVLLTFFLAVSVPAKLKKESKIVSQDGCPVEIESYEISYVKFNKSIWHIVKYKNPTNRTIVAVEFRFVLIDVFENFLSHHSHIEIEDLIPQVNRKTRKAKKPIKIDVFHGRRLINLAHTLRSFVYIHKLRFENGDIWEYDESDVIKQVTPLNKEFDLKAPDNELVEQKANKA